MRIRVVVADGGEALFYDAASLKGPLHLASRMTDPNARMHDRDLVTDRLGRKFERGPVGFVSGHAAGAENSPRRHEQQVFARRVAEELERSCRTDGFERVVVMAGPTFLGLLRNEFSNSVRSKVVAEIAKDLVHHEENAVRQHLPQEAFFV
jgi:protein required for attachment to host cells